MGAAILAALLFGPPETAPTEAPAPAPAPTPTEEEEGAPPAWLTNVEDWDAPEPKAPETPETPPAAEDEDVVEEPKPPAYPKGGVTGSARLVGAFLHYPDVPLVFPDGDDALVAAVGRVIFAHELTEHLRWEMNLFADLSRAPGSALAGTFSTAGSFQSPYRTTALVWDAWESGAVTGRLGVDRLMMGVHAGPVSFDLGRFPVNYTAAAIFTPNDFFAPFAATAINRIYKPGVDAARLGFTLGPLSELDIVAVMGTDEEQSARWARSALFAKISGVKWGWEGALLGGKLSERWVAGGSLQGDLGPVGMRVEGHAGFGDRNGDGDLDRNADGSRRKPHARLSAGPNVNFAWQNATIGAEYALFSDGAARPADYLTRFSLRFPDDLPYLGQHYVGLNAGFDTIPILRLQTVSLVNAGDGSGLAGLFLAYNIADEADLIAGAYVPWGHQGLDLGGETPAVRSEFGLQPVTGFIEMRAFF